MGVIEWRETSHHVKGPIDGGPKKASQWIHKVTVYGLESNRSYRYVVGSSDGWSDVLIMQTLPSGKEKIHRKYYAG